jgi:molybdopterin-guanine dinucleotide biosynthesis protein A
LPIGGELMLPRVVRLLSEAVSPIIVVASPGQELPPLPPEVTIASDPVPGRGPLQGLAAGLTALPDGVEAAYVSSCDVPLLLPAFVRRMIELLDNSEACIPQIAGLMHPLAAVYRPGVARVAEQLLNAGHSKLTDLFTVVRARFVAAEELAEADPNLRSLQNVNSPDDYAGAMRALSQ